MVHAIELSRSVHGTSPRGASLATPMIFLLVRVFIAIMSAAIPSINRWLRKFNTSMGTRWQNTAYGSGQGYPSGVASRGKPGNSFKMVPLTSTNKSQNGVLPETRTSFDNADRLDPRRPEYRANIQGPGAAGQSESRTGSQESVHSQSHIIRKATEWSVSYVTNDGPEPGTRS